MKKDDIYDGVTDIVDQQVTKAKKSKRGLIAGITAAAVVCAAVGGSLLLRGRDGGKLEPGKLDTPAAKKLALVQAEYPARTRYPETENGGEYDESQWDKWREESRARELTGEELDAMEGYYKAMLPALIEAAGERDTACSPANVYIALSMLAETTAGRSREQVLGLLGAGSVEAQRALAKRLWNALYNDDGTYSSLLANSLWLRDDTAYEKEPLETLSRDYYASSFAGQMGSGSYNGLLHDWMNGQTGGLLEDQIGGIALDPNTVLAIVSTAYFADRWSAPFDADRTDRQVFHGESGDQKRDFMHTTIGEGTYYWSDKFAGVELAFKSGGTMRLLLPDEGVGVEEVLGDPMAVTFLTAPSLSDAFADNRKTMDILLSLPKFDVTGDPLDLVGTLSALGVTDVFDPDAADFSPILKDGKWNGGPVYVNEIFHGARVKVDEEGCEAAAYTLIATNGAAEPQEVDKIEVNFDRPFLFCVVSGDVPLFAGCVRE